MFQLIDNIEPLNNDNNTMQYSPKLKKFVPIKHLKYHKLGKITVTIKGNNPKSNYTKAKKKLLRNAKLLHANATIHINYQQEEINKNKHLYRIIMNGLAVKIIKHK